MALANVALTDTFDVWRIRTNQIIAALETSDESAVAAFNLAAGANTIALAAFNKANVGGWTTNVVISTADNTNAALRITQTGTGHALLVEDSENPDATPFVITNTGMIGLGVNSPTIMIHANSASNSEVARFESADSPYITLYDNGILQGKFASENTAIVISSDHNKDITLQSTGAYNARIATNNSTRLLITPTGYTGIGTTLPETLLHISGGDVLVSRPVDITPDANWSGQFTIRANGYSGGLAFDNVAMWLGHNSPARDIIFATDETERVRVSTLGLNVSGILNVSNSVLISGMNIRPLLQSSTQTANLAYDKANSANILAFTAQNGFVAAFNKANSANIVASSAYDKANAANVLAFSAQNIATAAFNEANTADTVSTSAYDKANAANVLAFSASNDAADATAIAQAAFARANVANSQAISEFTGVAYDKANSANLLAFTAQNIGIAAFNKANSANIVAFNAFEKANDAYSLAASGGGAYDKANSANVVASAAFGQANSAASSASAAQSTATSASNIASAAFNRANSANVVASAAFGQANTATSSASAAQSTATSAAAIGSAAFGQANSAALLSAKASTLAQGGGNGTAMTFAYSAQTGTPTYVWGTLDGTTTRVYSPANFSVNYATSAGTSANSNYATSAGSATSATSAQNADYATSAGSATTATNATNATLAAKASTLSQGGGNGVAMTFTYSAQTGTPSYVWGTNDGTTIRVYSPATFNVSYATSAGSATLATKASTLSQGGGNGPAMTFNYNATSGTPTYVFGTTNGTTFNAYSPANFSVDNAAKLGGVASTDYMQKAGGTFSGQVVFSSTTTFQATASFTAVQGGTGSFSTSLFGSSLSCNSLSVGGGNISSVNQITATTGQFNTVSKISGTFKIDHPLPSMEKTHELLHSFIEGPSPDNIYRGKVKLALGKAQVNLDTASRMTEGTFTALNGNIQVFLHNDTGWSLVKGHVVGNKLNIISQDETCQDTVSWLVIGARQDKGILESPITDEYGQFVVERRKPVLE